MQVKTDIIIEARSGSKRLPNKHFLKIKRKYMIELLLERLKKVKNINDIIIATTKKKEDKKFEIISKKHKVLLFRGSENNVFNRVLRAAEKHRSKIICRVTGDCPLIDPKLIDELIVKFKKKRKIVYASNDFGLPNGMACEIFYLSSLKKCEKFKLNSNDKEHVTLFLRRNSNKFPNYKVIPKKNNFFPNLDITLDEKEDYQLIKKIYLSFTRRNQNLSCRNIVKYMKKNKNLLNINKNIVRKDIYLKNKFNL